jgi:hypothetical protein
VNLAARIPAFGPRRILVWGLVWSLALTIAETPLISRIDALDWQHRATWILLEWSQLWWWLLGCMLVWAAQRGERLAGTPGLFVALLLVSALNALVQANITPALRNLQSTIQDVSTLNITALLPSRNLDTWVSLSLYQFWVGISSGGLLVLVYALVSRRERMQHLLHLAALARGKAEMLLSAERLKAQQAQIDPLLLLTVMHDIEQRYREDPRRGDRLLTALVDFLRCAMPGLRERSSTLQRELALARAYLGLQAERGVSPGFRIDESASAERLAVAFPSLLILPLLALADGTQTTQIRVQSGAGALRLGVRGLAQLPDIELQHRIRRCLLAVHGEAFALHVPAPGPDQIEIVLPLVNRQGEHHVV